MGFLERFAAFHEQAARATGLDDFGGDDYHHALKLLLSDYDRHVRFNALGIAMIEGDIVGRLVSRLLLQQGLRAHPGALAAPIERPLVIVGMARTGTTALHRLLSQDPSLQSLAMWLGCCPMPRPPRDAWQANPLFRQVAQGLEQVYALNPAMRAVHPIWAHEPDECRFGMNHAFWAPDCATTAIIPDYARWVLHGDAGYAYDHYRRVLQLVGLGDSRRWLLKDVCHLFDFAAFTDRFPDACVVHTHRDPLVAFTSVANLIFQLRRLREDDPDPLRHGRLVLETWGPALHAAEMARRARPALAIVDLHNDTIHADPVGALERIYMRFGIPITPAARAAWQRRVAEDPTAGHGVHHYRPEDFGLTREAVHDACGAYMERYAGVCGDATSK